MDGYAAAQALQVIAASARRGKVDVGVSVSRVERGGEDASALRKARDVNGHL